MPRLREGTVSGFFRLLARLEHLARHAVGVRVRLQRRLDGIAVAAAECGDGFPEHGSFKRFLFEHASAQAMLDTINQAPEPVEDQWQVQLLALILVRARVGVYSQIAPDDIRRAHMEPVADIAARVAAELDRIGPDQPIAVLPEGPMTIPYLA